MLKKDIVQRESFSKILSAVEMPDLLDIQIQSFRNFLQDDVQPSKRKAQGIQEVFLSHEFSSQLTPYATFDHKRKGEIAKRPNATDCKSVDLCLRRFESFSPHHLKRV